MGAAAEPIEVREASDLDAERIAGFLRVAWAEAGPEAPGFAGATDAIIDALAQPTELRQHIGRGGERLFLGVAGGDVLGLAVSAAAPRSRTFESGRRPHRFRRRDRIATQEWLHASARCGRLPKP